jgi:hypothetical protein
MHAVPFFHGKARPETAIPIDFSMDEEYFSGIHDGSRKGGTEG